MTYDPLPTTQTFLAEVVGPVVVCAHLRGRPESAMEWITDNLAQLSRSNEAYGALLILKQGATPPDDVRRKAFTTALRHPGLKGFAVTVLGGGFWAAAARSIVTFFVVSGRLPVRIFNDTDSARDWLSDRLGPAAPDPAAIDRTVKTLLEPTST